MPVCHDERDVAEARPAVHRLDAAAALGRAHHGDEAGGDLVAASGNPTEILHLGEGPLIKAPIPGVSYQAIRNIGINRDNISVTIYIDVINAAQDITNVILFQA